MIKLLIFGSKGWIGNQFVDYLKSNDTNIDFLETDVRADNEEEVEKVILNYNPTNIISFIGRTYGNGINSIDYLEQKGMLKYNVRDNLFAPMVLASVSNKYNIHYILFGLPIEKAVSCLLCDSESYLGGRRDYYYFCNLL